MIKLLLVMILLLSGCVSHKLMRLCLPTADGRATIEGPSSLFWGAAMGTITIEGPAWYESMPVSTSADRLVLWKEVPDASCPVRP